MDPVDPVYVWDYGNGNKYLYYCGKFIWFDALNDQRSNFSSRLDADITEVRVSSNLIHLLVLVRLQDLGELGGGSTNPSIGIVIALDTDMNYTNGARQLVDGKTNTSKYAHGTTRYSQTSQTPMLNPISQYMVMEFPYHLAAPPEHIRLKHERCINE